MFKPPLHVGSFSTISIRVRSVDKNVAFCHLYFALDAICAYTCFVSIDKCYTYFVRPLSNDAGEKNSLSFGKHILIDKHTMHTIHIRISFRFDWSISGIAITRSMLEN